MSAALFVSLEGPEGAGKSTQARLLADALRGHGLAVTAVREPGGTALGERIRALLLDTADVSIDARAEVLLFCAARAQLVEQVLRPALRAGGIAVVDRYVDSTRAYQGGARGLPRQPLEDVLSFATDGLMPDLTVLLDLPAETGLNRKRQGDEALNRLDLESLAYHQAVRHAFLDLATAEPRRFLVLDARQPVADLAAEILGAVMERLG